MPSLRDEPQAAWGHVVHSELTASWGVWPTTWWSDYKQIVNCRLEWIITVSQSHHHHNNSYAFFSVVVLKSRQQVRTGPLLLVITVVNRQQEIDDICESSLRYNTTVISVDYASTTGHNQPITWGAVMTQLVQRPHCHTLSNVRVLLQLYYDNITTYW